MSVPGEDSLSNAEFEVIAEIRAAENRSVNAMIGEGSIVGMTSPPPLLRGILMNPYSQPPLPYRGIHSEPADEMTTLDLIITGIQGFLNQFLFPTDYVPGEERLHFLSNEEIDRLSLFEGTAEAYVKEFRNSPIPRKKRLELVRNLLDDDNYVEWERRCRQLLNKVTMRSDFAKQIPTYRGKLRAFLGSWSTQNDQSSPNIYLLENQFTAHRVPIINWTDGIRGRIGVSKGYHAWDIKVTGPLGSHCSVGIVMDEAPTCLKGEYVSLIGNDRYSWGWDIVWGKLNHDGKSSGVYPAKRIYEYTSGDTIRLLLDCDNSTLSYAVNEKGFGMAFHNLPKGVTFYPSIALVYGNITVALAYLGSPPPLRNNSSQLRLR